MASHSPILLLSSSPEFPSINDLLVKPPKKPVLRSGSNAGAIPDDGIKSFTTAACFWRRSQQLESERTIEDSGATAQHLETLMEDYSVVEDPKTSNALSATRATSTTPAANPPERTATQPTAPPPKPKRKAPTAKGKQTAVSAARVSETSTAAEPAVEELGTTPAVKPARKRRTAKSTTESCQTTLPKGKVTKPATKVKTSNKKIETASRHFSTEQPSTAQPAASEPIDHAPLELEIAPRRRVDWTPPPEDDRPRDADYPSAVKEVTAADHGPGQASMAIQQPSFRDLLGDFSHKEDSALPSESAAPSINADVLGKRKLVQMVAVAAASMGGPKAVVPETSPAKTKQPKKKARTITELATAAYRQPDETDASEAAPVPKESVLTYFEIDGEPAGNATTGDAPSAKPKPGKKKPAKPRVSKKKVNPRKQLVLSPSSALKQVAVQDFVFGTASQLATEEDPDLLRALHEAMKASNHPDTDPFSPSPVAGDLPLRRRAGNKLWTAGARNDDGDLIDLEILDLTGSPEPPRDYLLLGTSFLAKEKEAPRPDEQRIPVEIASSDFDPVLSIDAAPKSLFLATQVKAGELAPPPLPSTPRKQQDGQQSHISEADFEPPPSNQEHHQLLSQPQSTSPMKRKDPLKDPEALARPKFELYTDAQLAREIAKYGFKPVRVRKAMIALLDQCWVSKTSTALGIPVGGATSPAAISTSARRAALVREEAAAKSPSRPRGRPKKNAAAPITEEVGGERAQPAKRPRGRPKKDAAATAPPQKATKKAVAAAPVVAPPPSTPPKRNARAKELLEIPDSDCDDDPFASSPASSPEATQEALFSPPQSQADVSITEDTEMSLMAMSPTAQQMTLFGYITKAVTSAPPTKNSSQPSWHEKILMYDPVILEDLAAWLNAGQLDKVGYDREVAPGDVKKWCESKSVCCIWRVNVHGKERKRC